MKQKNYCGIVPLYERLDLSDTLEKEREKVEKARLELDFNREIRSSLESLGEDLEKRIQTLQKYLKESQDHCKELEVNLEKEREKADKFDLALQSLTPCGSEFAHDPERCVEYVKEVRNHQQELIKKFVRRAKEAEEQVEKLILSKQDIEGQLEILRPEYKGLQERGKDLQEHNSKLGLLFVGQTEIRVGLEERVRELEAILASIKADPSIGKLEIVNGVEDG